MNLSTIESGTEIFIDANIFIYHFTGASNECSEFLSRCEQGDIHGLTSVNVILEVLHRLMMIEAVRKKLAAPPNIVKKLQKQPAKIKLLNEYFINTKKIIDIGIEVNPISMETVFISQSTRLAHGLMVNDSLIIANMQELGINSLATNDKKLGEIEELFVYTPSDVDIHQ
ncbi:MAG: type II toxin-antitoxin system VapC family toxin [Nitrospirae bacterium]|nr:type II toxin-antitoxin system VapC family toxin [Nitrospirota bacterium]